MAKKQMTRQAEFLTDWEQLIATLLNNSGEVPHLEAPRLKLEAYLEAARSLSQEQDRRDAEKQMASRQLDETFANGKKLATFLRNGIKEHYGNRNPRLVEFGIQPFRRGGGSEPEPPPTPVPEEPEPETPPVE